VIFSPALSSSAIHGLYVIERPVICARVFPENEYGQNGKIRHRAFLPAIDCILFGSSGLRFCSAKSGDIW